MGRPSEQRIDYAHLREWLAAVGAREPCTVSRTLRVIRENATPKQRDYVDRFFGDGESVSRIAEQSGVSPSTVSHTIRNAVSAAGEWLEEHLPKVALRPGEEPEQQPATVRRLHMSESEIAVRYRQAKDRAGQIGILAELNATTKGVIRQVLAEQGVELPEVTAPKNGRCRVTAAPLQARGVAECPPSPVGESGEKKKPGCRKRPGPPVPPQSGTEREKNKEERPVTKTDAKAMSLDVMAEIAKNVRATFPDAEVRMEAGVPVGMALTVRYDAEGNVAASELRIEAVER